MPTETQIRMASRTLRTDLRVALSEIEAQIKAVYAEAREMKIEAVLMKDSHGNFILSPLLTAKAQVLAALTDLVDK